MRRMEQRRAAMLGVIAVVMVTAACGSPATKAASHPEPTHPVATSRAPAAQEFGSKRYGFRLTLAEDWDESDAQVAWDGRELHGLQSPDFADFAESGTERAFAIGAAPA